MIKDQSIILLVRNESLLRINDHRLGWQVGALTSDDQMNGSTANVDEILECLRRSGFGALVLTSIVVGLKSRMIPFPPDSRLDN